MFRGVMRFNMKYFLYANNLYACIDGSNSLLKTWLPLEKRLLLKALP